MMSVIGFSDTLCFPIILNRISNKFLILSLGFFYFCLRYNLFLNILSTYVCMYFFNLPICNVCRISYIPAPQLSYIYRCARLSSYNRMIYTPILAYIILKLLVSYSPKRIVLYRTCALYPTGGKQNNNNDCIIYIYIISDNANTNPMATAVNQLEK